MGQDAGTPPGLKETIRQLVATEMGKFARSGFLRNASISEGGLTIKGGFFRLLSEVTGGVSLFYIGPLGDPLPDGSYQQGLSIRRADGTAALQMFDANTINGEINQALTWRDRASNIVFADDTESGQGLARPWLPIQVWPRGAPGGGGFQQTGLTTFAALWAGELVKQQPRIYCRFIVNVPTGTTAEVRLTVGGTPVGATITATAGTVYQTIGPLAVDGTHMQGQDIEIQARVTSGTGLVGVAMHRLEGRQS